jgi:DNA-binding protein HU-beta
MADFPLDGKKRKSLFCRHCCARSSCLGPVPAALTPPRPEVSKGLRTEKMSKKDLIDAVAEHAEITKEKAGIAVDAIITYIEKSLKKGDEVSIPPLGKFKVTKRKARTGRNPSTGEEIKIPASIVPKFQPSKTLKDTVNRR